MNHRFYCVSAPAFTTQMKAACKQYPGLMPIDNLRCFFNEKIPNVLTSVGTNISAKPKDRAINHKGIVAFAEKFPETRDDILLKECNWAVDNGGYQIAQCFVLKEHLDEYRHNFHEFVRDQHRNFHMTFTLDMVPMSAGPDGSAPCLFDTVSEMYDVNFRSYAEAAALPDAAREKMRCVFHFGGPRIFRAWRRMLFQEGLAERFTHFATGGLVHSNGFKSLPVVGFTVPLVPLLVFAKEHGRPAFDYHVLGQGQPMHILKMRFIEAHVKRTTGIDVHFTHDALSPLNESFFRGGLTLMDNDKLTVRRVSLTSEDALMYYEDNKSAADALYEVVNTDLEPYNIGPFVQREHRFMNGDGTLTNLGYTLSYINQIYNRSKMWAWSDMIVANIYPVYRAGGKQPFVERFTDVVGSVIQAQSHENTIRADAEELAATFDFITRLDPDYADSLVCHRLINEESPHLSGSI